MSLDYAVVEQEEGRFVYKQGDLSITLYKDGMAIHGARDPFANETWNVLFGNDVAEGIIRLFNNTGVQKQFLSTDTS
jgi:hypothetical protein